MMSPLSLAKYLPSQAMSFDLLVIDEASQMKPEDALGGLLRARQVIVVGDRNQLPPRDFFTRVTPAEEFGADADEDADDIDAESILDWALKTYQAPRRLKWHYRSRCESLIAFSNREFYASRAGSAGELITFPSARPGAFSIDLVRVDGNYKAGRNPVEVNRVVDAAIDFMIRNSSLPPDQIPTLGIAAMNRRTARSDPRGVQPGGARRGGRAIPRRLRCRHADPQSRAFLRQEPGEPAGRRAGRDHDFAHLWP